MSGFGISGLGSGVDWGAYVDAIIQGEQQGLANTLGRREVKLSAEKTVFSNVKGVLDGLNTAVRSFRFSGDFKTKSVTVSDPTKLTGTATLSAAKQNLSITVESLARAESQRYTFDSMEGVVAGADTDIEITVRGTAHTITVPAGSTFEDLRNLINNAKIGVTAAAFDSNDGTGEPVRLVLTDNKVGDEDSVATTANIVVDFTGLNGTLATQDDDMDPTTGAQFLQQASNAEITINGDTVIRNTNTISDVIPGVSLTLLEETDPGEPITINVVESTKDAASKVKTLVEKYNEAIRVLRAAVQFDPSAEVQTNPTAGNSTLRNILSRLQSVFMGTVATLPNGDTAVRSLSDIGVKSSFSTEDTANNGILSFDESKFNALLNSNYDDVVQFFEGLEDDGTTYKGFADTMSDTMDTIVAGTTGAIPGKLKSIDESLKRLNDEKLDKLERLQAKEERLRAKFARLEGQMARLNGQQSTLNQSIQALQLNNQFIANRK